MYTRRLKPKLIVHFRPSISYGILHKEMIKKPIYICAKAAVTPARAEKRAPVRVISLKRTALQKNKHTALNPGG